MTTVGTVPARRVHGVLLDRIPHAGRFIVETTQADYLIDLDGLTLERWPVRPGAGTDWDCAPLQIRGIAPSRIGSRLSFSIGSSPVPYVMEVIESITDVTSGFAGCAL